ncbi:MAG: CoA transferase [Acidimicrobiia bacterium]
MSTPTPLDFGYRVVDLTEGIAGAYCTKVLADGGADVITVEMLDGNRLRQRSAIGAPVDPSVGGVLFQYLSCSKRGVVVDVDDESDLTRLCDLVRTADTIVWNETSRLCLRPELSVDGLRKIAPNASIVALTGYGLTGPWADRPSNEFIWQSLSGSAWNHGSIDGAPVMMGGAHGDFALGTLGAFGALVAKARTDVAGGSEVVEVSGLEVLQLTHHMFPITFLDTTGRPYRPFRTDPIPGIHRTKDGWVGLWVTTGQQWLDFCTMTERFDWLADESLALMDNRATRHDELVDAIEGWTLERTTEEIVEFAALLRIPVAPIGTGETLPTFDHFRERNQFVPNPRSGFTQPDVWYTSTGAFRRPFAPSPLLGEHTDEVFSALSAPRTPARDVSTHIDIGSRGDAPLPFEDLRIVDMTAFWAGPIIGHGFAMLGADVIHVESVKRPDGIRMATTIPMSEQGWWETSPFFNGTNTNKRGLTVDLQTARGLELLKALIAQSDVVIENYSSRVMDQLGLSYEQLTAIKPDIIMVRAPAFGTWGPWKDRVGYAPTIDQASGLAWVTGDPNDAPQMVGAASDAVGGLHASLALLQALDHRRRTGEGALIESPQVGTALQVSAEQVGEYAASGTILTRTVNKSWVSAPQGCYRSADRPSSFDQVPPDDWVAISVESDEQWTALCAIVGIGDDLAALDVTGRQAAHDRIDALITEWSRGLDSEKAADMLCAAGIPASRVVPPHEQAGIESLVARGFYETVDKAVVGKIRVPRFPLNLSRGPSVWNRTAAPTLGQDNRAILEGLLGLTAADVDQLETDGIIGYATSVNLGW